MQPLQQKLLRKPEGNEALLAYQAGGLQGVSGVSNFSSHSAMPLPQQSRKFFELAQQHGSSQEGQNRSQGPDQQVSNPLQQAYLQYAFQAAQQKSALAMQSQQHAKMGLLGPPSGKDQDMRMGNLKMQELMSIQAANQAQASSSKTSSEHFARGEKQMEQGQPVASDQRSESKPLAQPAVIGQLMPGNVIRPMQVPQTQQNIQNMASNQLAMAQLQAVQAWAVEHNIDLSLPGNANLIAQLIPLVQSRLVGQQKANESNMGVQSSPVPVSKQQVTSPQVVSENSPRANSSSEASGQSGSAKAKQALSSGPFGSSSNAGGVNHSNSIPMSQFPVHGRESQVPFRQPVVTSNGIPPMHSLQSPANMSQGLDQSLHAKNSLSSSESMQMQYNRPVNRSSPQAPAAINERASSSQIPPQGGPPTHLSQQRPGPSGFTKQQLHVLKAQILAFRRLKVCQYLSFALFPVAHNFCLFIFSIFMKTASAFKVIFSTCYLTERRRYSPTRAS